MRTSSSGINAESTETLPLYEKTPLGELAPIPVSSSGLGAGCAVAGGPDIQIVIADCHCLFREGLRDLLETQPGFHVLGEAGDVPELLRLLRQLEPDVLLLDLRMRDASGVDVLQALSLAGKRPRTIAMAVDIDKRQASDVFKLGARGVILKESRAASLFECINAVAAGLYWVIREPATECPVLEQGRDDFKKQLRPANFSLTNRELEIVAAVVSGKSNNEIAGQFSISVQTVKHHLTSIFDKVGVYNRLELSLFVVHHRSLLQPPAKVSCG